MSNNYNLPRRQYRVSNDYNFPRRQAAMPGLSPISRILHSNDSNNGVRLLSLYELKLLSWLVETCPDNETLATTDRDIPKQLVSIFCKENRYNDKTATELKRWLEKDLERLRKNIKKRANLAGVVRTGRVPSFYKIGSNLAETDLLELSLIADEKTNNVSSIERYRKVLYHCTFFFLAADDFPLFIKTFWEDIDHLTGDLLDVYYSKQDIVSKVSGYKSSVKSGVIAAEEVPCIVVWKEKFDTAITIPLRSLTHKQVFEVVTEVVKHIRTGISLGNIHLQVQQFIAVRFKPQNQANIITKFELSGNFKGAIVNAGSDIKESEQNTNSNNTSADFENKAPIIIAPIQSETNKGLLRNSLQEKDKHQAQNAGNNSLTGSRAQHIFELATINTSPEIAEEAISSVEQVEPTIKSNVSTLTNIFYELEYKLNKKLSQVSNNANPEFKPSEIAILVAQIFWFLESNCLKRDYLEKLQTKIYKYQIQLAGFDAELGEIITKMADLLHQKIEG